MTREELLQQGGTIKPATMSREELMRKNGVSLDEKAGLFSKVLVTKEELEKPKYRQRSALSFLPGELKRVGDLAYQGFQNLPIIKYPSYLTGAVGAAAGGLLGGGIGLLGGATEGIIREQDISDTAVEGMNRTAKETGKLGWEIGKTVPTIAASMGGGIAVTAPLVLGQFVSGTAKALEAVEMSKDEDIPTVDVISKAGEAILDFALGTISANSAIQSLRALPKGALSPAKEMVTGKLTPGLIASPQVVEWENWMLSSDRKLLKAKEATAKFIGTSRAALKSETKEATKARATGKEAPDQIGFMTQEGIVPRVKEIGGKQFYDVDDALEITKQRAGAVDSLFTKAMDEIDPMKRFDLVKIGRQLADDAADKFTSEMMKEAARQKVYEYFNTEVASKGRMVNIGQLNDIKRGLYEVGHYSKLTAPESDKPFRAAGESLAQLIKMEMGDQLDVDSVNKVLGDYSRSADILRGLENKPIAKINNNLIQSVLSYATGKAGQSVGIPMAGSILGYDYKTVADVLGVADSGDLKLISAWLQTNPQFESSRVSEIITSNMAAARQFRENVPKLGAGPIITPPPQMSRDFEAEVRNKMFYQNQQQANTLRLPPASPQGSPQNPIVVPPEGMTPGKGSLPAAPNASLVAQPPADTSGTISPNPYYPNNPSVSEVSSHSQQRLKELKGLVTEYAKLGQTPPKEILTEILDALDEAGKWVAGK